MDTKNPITRTKNPVTRTKNPATRTKNAVTRTKNAATRTKNAVAKRLGGTKVFLRNSPVPRTKTVSYTHLTLPTICSV